MTRRTSARTLAYFIADLERRIAAGEGDASWQAKLQQRLLNLKGQA